ncbi:739_t:CDS:2, partial [Acaulospora morrowiae]
KKNSRSSTSSIIIKTTSLEEKKINDFLNIVHKEMISEKIREKIREKNPSSQEKVQKIMSKISENSSFKNNDNIDRDVTTTTQDETESLPSNTNFTLLYGKLCDAIILTDPSERQVDPESNTVSRILNKEVKADTSDSLLRKRIKKAKKLYKLFDAIDNVSFDYIIDVSLPLAELRDDEKSSVTQLCSQETSASSIPLSNTSGSEDLINENNKYLPVKEISMSTGTISKDKKKL